jgi:NAD(P) transhydrogenase subunit alpha
VSVGVVAESAACERRVALVPKMIERLKRRGVRGVVGAGAAARPAKEGNT